MAMKSKVLVEKAVDIAQHYKTLYVMGCFGAPMTAANKKRYTKNNPYNTDADRTRMINAATADTFGFDCVCLIKGILWGWTGDKSKAYGGAQYASNGVPDIGADSMIARCTGVSTTGWASMVPGEAVWCKGHIGIYIGDGLAVECSPRWANKVQITAVAGCGKKAGYNTRTWTKHGKIPWVDYSDQSGAPRLQGGGQGERRRPVLRQVPGRYLYRDRRGRPPHSDRSRDRQGKPRRPAQRHQGPKLRLLYRG